MMVVCMYAWYIRITCMFLLYVHISHCDTLCCTHSSILFSVEIIFRVSNCLIIIICYQFFFSIRNGLCLLFACIPHHSPSSRLCAHQQHSSRSCPYLLSRILFNVVVDVFALCCTAGTGCCLLRGLFSRAAFTLCVRAGSVVLIKIY